MGRPEVEIENEITSLKKQLAKQMDESEIPETNALMVFTSDQVEIDAGDSPIPAIKVKQLKDFIRQRAKERLITQAQLAEVKAALPE
jgi:hypothetical protein